MDTYPTFQPAVVFTYSTYKQLFELSPLPLLGIVCELCALVADVHVCIPLFSFLHAQPLSSTPVSSILVVSPVHPCDTVNAC